MSSLLNKIESLRQQPKAVRNRYALTVAFFFTFIVAGVWGVALTAKVASYGDATKDAVVTIPSPSRWWNTMQDMSQSFSASLMNRNETESSEPVTESNRLDIEALSQPTPPPGMITPAATGTESAGVWQRQYQNTAGRPVLIATTSASSSSPDSR